MPPPRLPWKPNPEGGYIAYPEGERFENRRATIRYDETSSIKWQWWIVYDDAKKADHARSKQAAADAATAAWPLMKAEAGRLAAEAAETEALRTLIQRMMSKGDLPLSVFGIEDSDNERLKHIIWLVRDAGGLDGPAKPLVEACSAELFRRRTGRP